MLKHVCIVPFVWWNGSKLSPLPSFEQTWFRCPSLWVGVGFLVPALRSDPSGIRNCRRVVAFAVVAVVVSSGIQTCSWPDLSGMIRTIRMPWASTDPRRMNRKRMRLCVVRNCVEFPSFSMKRSRDWLLKWKWGNPSFNRLTKLMNTCVSLIRFFLLITTQLLV